VSFSFAHEGGRPAVVAGRFFCFEAPSLVFFSVFLPVDGFFHFPL
jgi:hypothetical protein